MGKYATFYSSHLVFGSKFHDYIGRSDEPGKYNNPMCRFINAIDHFDTRLRNIYEGSTAA